MSGLPTQIPPQNLAFIEQGKDGQSYVQFDWYLFLYNLSRQVFSSQSGSTPVSPYDVLDAANLIAQSADLPQAYRQIANAAVFDAQNLGIAGVDIQHLELGITNLKKLVLGLLPPDSVPAAQPVQSVTVGASPFTYTALYNGTLSITGGTVSAVSVIRQGVSVATGIASSSAGAIGSMTDEKGSGGTFGFASGVDFTAGTTTSLTLSQAYGSASDLWVAFDGVEQGADSYSLSSRTLTFTSAIPVGTNKVYVKGALPSTIGLSGNGLIPLRRLDQVQITYSAAPAVAFLPQ